MVISQDITNEVMFLFHSIILGVVITFVYDGFLILRRLFRHTIFLISLEDFIFWIACALSVFCVLCRENNGVLRWFAIAGAAVGMLVYKKTVSPLFVNALSKALSLLFRILGRIVRILMKPFRFLLRKAAGGSRSIGQKTGKLHRSLHKSLRKKLTECKKTLRMILCKQ